VAWRDVTGVQCHSPILCGTCSILHFLRLLLLCVGCMIMNCCRCDFSVLVSETGQSIKEKETSVEAPAATKTTAPAVQAPAATDVTAPVRQDMVRDRYRLTFAAFVLPQ
jgi:hypothetical protein